MNDIERALSQISDIREQLAASTRFRGYAPEVIGLVGLGLLAVLLAQLVWPDRFAASPGNIVETWGSVLVLATLAIAVEAMARARNLHGGMAGAMLAAALRMALPATLVAAVTGWSVLHFAPEVTWLLPGLWQMVIGIVVFSSYSILPKAIVGPAVWYLAIGVLVTLHAGYTQTVTPLTAGLPLVIGHFYIAWALRKGGLNDDR